MDVGLSAREAGSTPEEAARAFGVAVEGRDVEAAGGCFSADACMLTPDRTEVRGKAGVRDLLAQLAVTHPTIRVGSGRMVKSGAVAVATQRWEIASKGPDTGLVERRLNAVLVLSREPEGWRIVVAAPWGL